MTLVERQSSGVPEENLTPAMTRRVVVAGFVGTTIEFFDFFIFGIAAALIFDKIYFAALGPNAAVLASFATFGVAFVARPLGSLAFGHFGDRVGRKTMLVTSLLMMGIGTVAVGLLPAYDTIGVAAPILLVALRFVQGIGLGGEFGGVMLMITEHAPKGRRGMFAAFAQLGPPIGLILASSVFLLLSAVMDAEAFASWGWRIPFLASAVLVIVGLYVRLNVTESAVFQAVLDKREQARMPVAELIRTHGLRVLLAAGPSVLTSTLFFLITTQSLWYGTAVLELSRNAMLIIIIMVMAVNALVTIPLGAISDRFGRRRLTLWGIAMSALWAFPMYWLTQTGNPFVVAAAFSVGIVFMTLLFAPLGAFLSEMFDTKVRFTGTSVSFNIGALLGGGLAPTLATQLGNATGNAWWSFSAYILVAALVAFGCVLALPETKDLNLAGPRAHLRSGSTDDGLTRKVD